MNEWIPVVTSIGALVISVLSLWQKSVSAYRSAEATKAKVIINGYSSLVDDLQKQLEVQRLEIERLSKEVARLEEKVKCCEELIRRLKKGDV